MPWAEKAGLALIGAVSGGLLWGVGKAIGQPEVPPLLVLGVFVLVLTQAILTLSLAGPLRLGRALTGALRLSLPITALFLCAGLRHPVATNSLEQPAMVIAGGAILLVGAPFLLVRLVSPRDWRRYDALFDAAWTMHLRFLAAWVFAGIFWLVLLLSNALLELVRLPLMTWILAPEWTGFALTGAMFGIGMAVVYDLRETVSPFILFRLLRILVPVVLVVLGIFVAAVPFSGLSDIFGPLSAAATLMGMVLLVLVLVNAAIDRSDGRAVGAGWLRQATRLLSFGTGALGLLAMWALAERVRQYGWTPQRVIAISAAAVLLAYGVAYALAALRGAGWMGRLREANVVLAMVTIVASAVLMTPVLNPYRIATASQINRFLAGRTTPEAMPLWEMAHDWGHAGRAGLVRLETAPETPDGVSLTERIALARGAPSLGSYRAEERRQDLPERMARLFDLMPVRPEGALGRMAFSDTSGYRLDTWEQGCARRLDDGRPGCVLVFGDFLPDGPAGGQAILLYRLGDGGVWGGFASFRDGAIAEVQPLIDPRTGTPPALTVADIARAQDGAFQVRPSPAQVLGLGEVLLGPAP
jgi:hypothetical protein